MINIPSPKDLVDKMSEMMRKREFHFRIFKKKSSFLKPGDLMGIRPYHEYYYRREEDDRIDEILKERKNLLVVGKPLAGKTRACFEGLKSMEKHCSFSLLKHVEIDIEYFSFPEEIAFWRDNTVMIDDLQRYTERRYFDHVLRFFASERIQVIATCRSGKDFESVRDRMLDQNIPLELIFKEDNIVELLNVSPNEGMDIAEKTGEDWDKVSFDGTVGSVFMKLVEMERRFRNSSPDEKSLLRTIKKLYKCGIYRGDLFFPYDWIRRAAAIHKDSFEDLVKSLDGKELLGMVEGGVTTDEVYLDEIIKPDPTDAKNDLQILWQMVDNFSIGPGEQGKRTLADALFRLAYRADDLGAYRLDKAYYMKVTIRAYEKALKIYTRDKFPLDYAMTHNNLGNAYSNLADVEDKKPNILKAVASYNEALKVYKRDKFPMQYAMTHNNLGTAYSILADVEDKKSNILKAKASFEKALVVYKRDAFPLDYAMTHNNLGTAYRALSDVEDKKPNILKAVASYNEALKVYKRDAFPLDYAMTHNNLGTAYRALSDVENKKPNILKAVASFEKALEIYTRDELPMQYAMTHNNLGTAYANLADVEDKKPNILKAIASFKKALEIFTEDEFPDKHLLVKENLEIARDLLEGD